MQPVEALFDLIYATTFTIYNSNEVYKKINQVISEV